MWECPDLFPLKDKHVLLVSPQGIKPKGYHYLNVCNTGYLVGTWEPGSDFKVENNFTPLDNGYNFYAPQTFLTPDGRRIMMAWMVMWDDDSPEVRHNWNGMLTLPRELDYSDGLLIQNPIKEVEQLRCNDNSIENKDLNNEYFELEPQVFAMEINMDWDLTSSDAEKYGLHLGSKDGQGVYLYVNTQANSLTLERRYPNYNLSGYRSIELPRQEKLNLRVFFDHSSVEVFVNEGKATMTSRIYPDNDQRHLSIFAENGSASLVSSTRWKISKTKDC